GTGFYYLVRRNPKKKPNKMELKKYDKVVRKHVIFKEQKI
ncbi:MAG: 50S ribosomal protein L33, partial [Rickettsiales bacterium]|nr:50S ribosomal protein L33 [Rickettsiales bacterium]MDR2526352.1 50S ribosomal protein L33 [Rickettsiales bacterium]